MTVRVFCVIFFFRQTGRRGQQSVMQQSCGRGKRKTDKKKTEMGTRGSGVRREVADSERKDFLEEVASG